MQAVFYLTLVALISLLATGSLPAREFPSTIDWRLIFLLGSFMLLAEGLKGSGLIERIAGALALRARSLSGIYLFSLTSAFILAMLVTNDAALFAIVPFSLALGRRTPLNIRRLVIYEIMGVNLGSAFTPWGNPQNLFIYHRYHLTPLAFFRESAPFALLGFAILALLILVSKALFEEREAVPPTVTAAEIPVSRGKSAILSGLFVLLVLSVLRAVPVYISAGLTVLYMGSAERRGFKRIDWWLLGTFLLLFPTMSGLGGILSRALGGAFNSPLSVYGAGIGISQWLSNVPTAMLLSHATADWRSLFYGVNVGGLGTAVASFANLIGLSLYLKEAKGNEWKGFIMESLGWNLIILVILGGVFALFIG